MRIATEQPALLITDDDRDFRETLRELFETRGYHALVAENGEEAVEILRAEQIHVAVFDMHMPRLDGLAAVQRLREFRISVPCILLSASLDDQLAERARRNDIFAALAKPVSARDLTRTVAAAMRRDRA